MIAGLLIAGFFIVFLLVSYAVCIVDKFFLGGLRRVILVLHLGLFVLVVGAVLISTGIFMVLMITGSMWLGL